MGAEKPMMERLLNVFTALEEKNQRELDRLRATAKPTPPTLNVKFTPNQKLLQAAVAYANALLLKAPGTDPDRARKLARRVFHSAWFERLSALEPQFQAGVQDDGPWFKFWNDADPPKRNGGESPFPPPDRPPRSGPQVRGESRLSAPAAHHSPRSEHPGL